MKEQPEETQSRDQRRVTTQTMGERIEHMRLKSNLTQKQLAKAIGKSTRSISRYESGEHAPREAVLELIAEQLGVSAGWLREGEDYEEDIPDKQPQRWWTEEQVIKILRIDESEFLNMKLYGDLLPRLTDPDRYLDEDIIEHRRMKQEDQWFGEDIPF